MTIRGKRTILMVDDNLADQEMVRRAVGRSDGPLQLVTIDDGEQALNYLLRRDVYAGIAPEDKADLVMLNLQLPTLSGRELLATIRTTPTLKRLPVLVCSATAHDQDVRDAYRLGCNSYLMKPAHSEQFEAAIESIIAYWFGVVLLPSES